MRSSYELEETVLAKVIVLPFLKCFIGVGMNVRVALLDEESGVCSCRC